MKKKKLSQILNESINDGFNVWPNVEKQNSAAQRIESKNYLNIKFSPKFKLSEHERYFTIGSCFARNIERKLLAFGADVLSSGLKVSPDWISHKQAKGSDILNKFNTHSMFNEIHRCLCPEKYSDPGFINVNNDGWYDPQTSYTAILNYEDCFQMRKRIEKLYLSLKDATTVILTLGMTESWIDDETGIFINGLPLPDVIRHHKNRFSFFNASVRSVEKVLTDIIGILKEKCKSDIKIIFTISPVPLRKTFTNTDIFVANTLSKSTLRVAAQHVSQKFNNVDYYPSYEMVVNSPREISWEEDAIHVDDKLVGNIISYFIEKYQGI